MKFCIIFCEPPDTSSLTLSQPTHMHKTQTHSDFTEYMRERYEQK